MRKKRGALTPVSAPRVHTPPFLALNALMRRSGSTGARMNARASKRVREEEKSDRFTTAVGRARSLPRFLRVSSATQRFLEARVAVYFIWFLALCGRGVTTTNLHARSCSDFLCIFFYRLVLANTRLAGAAKKKVKQVTRR